MLGTTAILGLISVIIRIIGSGFLLIVIEQQIRLRLKSGHDELNGFRHLLITLTTIPFLANFLIMYNNYVRITDGAQSEIVNNIVIILGAVSYTAVAFVLWKIYRNK